MALLRTSRACAHLLRQAHHSAPAPSTARACATATSQTDAEKIAQLRAGVAPASGRPLKEIAAEVWGHNTSPAGPGARSGLKILERPLKGHLYASWYPPPPWKTNPEWPDRKTDKQLRWSEKLKKLRAMGKGPPPKGAGKRKK